MKKLLFLLTLSASMNAFAGSGMITLDANEICPNLESYTYGRSVAAYEIESCTKAIEGNKFQKEAALICINLPYYSYNYYVDGSDVVSCFQRITNKAYSTNRLEYCKSLQGINYRNNRYTSADDVYNCLK